MNNSFHNILFLLLLIILQFSIVLTSKIEIPFSIYQSQTIYSNVTIGTPIKRFPSQTFSIELDTGSYYLWVREFIDDIYHRNYDAGFIPNISSSFVNRTFYTELKSIYCTATGFEIEDHMTIGPVFIPHFHFVLSNNTKYSSDIDGILGLGFTMETNDLISFLYSSHQIAHKVFSFNMNSNMLLIGAIPSEIQKDIKHFSYCRVLKDFNRESNTKWKCMLKGIYLQGNRTNFLNDEVPIDINTGTSMVIVDNYLLNSLLIHLISTNPNGNCELESKVRHDEINCSEDLEIEKVGHLNLQIEGMTIKIPKEDLFIKNQNDNSYTFLFKAIPNQSNWVIGFPLLQYFHSVFDMDKGIVGLHSKHNIINEYNINTDDIMIAYKNYSSLFVNNILFTVVFLSCLIGIVINSVFKYKLQTAY